MFHGCFIYCAHTSGIGAHSSSQIFFATSQPYSFCELLAVTSMNKFLNIGHWGSAWEASGFRKAAMLAGPAHLDSVVQARPCVAYFFRLAREVGVDLFSAMSILDGSITRAQ